MIELEIPSEERKAFEPQNEQGVFYLFARYHEKLGFREVVRFNPNEAPDIVAIKHDGEQVGIELEYETRRVLEHYFVLSEKERNETEKKQDLEAQTGKYIVGEWVKVGSEWNFVFKGEKLLTKKEGYPNQYWYHKPMNRLLRRTVKETGIDIVMYWVRNEKPEDFKFWEFDKDVESVNLKEELSKIKSGVM